MFAKHVSILAAAGAVAAVAAPLPASAQNVRLIKEEASTSPATAFQDHTNNTPYKDPGQTFEFRRGRLTYVWVYEHGIDLLPTSITDNDPNTTGREFQGVGGRMSRVLLPSVGNLLVAAGGKSYEIDVGRNVEIGDTISFVVRKPTGTIPFKAKVVCEPNPFETESKPISLAASSRSFAAGTEGTFTLILDVPPPCQNQAIRFDMPTCFETQLPGQNGRSRGTITARLEWTDPKNLTLPLYAAASGACQAKTSDLVVTTSGVTKRFAVSWTDPEALKPKIVAPVTSPVPKPVVPVKPITITPKPGTGK